MKGLNTACGKDVMLIGSEADRKIYPISTRVQNASQRCSISTGDFLGMGMKVGVVGAIRS